MKLGMLPRRSSSVCIFTAALVERNGAHGNTDRHRSMVVASRAYTVLDRSTPKGSSAYKLARNADQALGEVGIDAPVAHRVGVGQGVPRHRAAKAHVVQLGCLTAQAGFDVAQALPIGQLGEGHAQVLVETGEVLDLVFPVVAGDTAAKGGQRQMRHDLREDEFARVHERGPQSGWKNPEMLRATFKSRPASNTEYPQSFNLLYDPSVRTLGHY
jgi:hypothetical protein